MVILKSVTALFLLTLLATAVPAESEFCAVDGPASVLACYEKAYAERDLDLLDALLAPDYQFFFHPGNTSWGRAEDLESAASMFSAPWIKAINIEIGGEYTTSEGPEADTWILEGITATIRLEVEKQPIMAATQEMRILVREVPEPEPHFVVVERHDTKGK